jgi:hypothetical protein
LEPVSKESLKIKKPKPKPLNVRNAENIAEPKELIRIVKK